MPDDNFWPGPGEFNVEVVGESHYQKALRRIAGPQTEDGVRMYCRAELYLEPDNPHDPNAVCVKIERSTVGYLPRTVAPAVRQALAPVGISNGMTVEVDAVISGGRYDQNYGVWLDIPTAPASAATPKKGFFQRLFGR